MPTLKEQINKKQKELNILSLKQRLIDEKEKYDREEKRIQKEIKTLEDNKVK